MSFGGGFGSFGQNNNQSSGGFGGFGANNNNNNNTPSTTTGFGTNAGGFGSNGNTGGGMFGANNTNNNTTGGFGSTAGGFGSPAGGFGSKPAFGSTATPTTTGGLFNNNNTTTTTAGGFGGFGTNTNTTTSAFGANNNNTGSGLFGNNNKPGFGTTAATGGSLFGGGNNATTGGGFGGFGSGSSNTLGGGAGDPTGTANTPFQAFNEKEPNSSTNLTNAFQNILFQDPYKKWSADELRLADYVQGRRHGNASGAGAFGVGSGFGGAFGTNTQAPAAATPAAGGFGSASNTAGSGLFGSNNTNTNMGSGFGGFGGNNNNTSTANTSSSLFGGANKPSGGLFAGNTQNQTGGMFGNNNTAGGGFGSANNSTGGGLFGSANNNTGGGLFGAGNQAKPANTGFSFGNTNATPNTATTGFGGTANSAFGPPTNNTTGSGLFGGNNNNNNTQASGGLFGNNQPQQNNTGGLFGQQSQSQQTGGLFGNNQQKPASGGLFNSAATNTNTSGGLFGNAATQQQGSTGLGNANTNTSLFGAKPNTGGGGLFGSGPIAQNNTTGGAGLFGGVGSSNQTQQPAGTGLFGSVSNQQKPSLFGSAQTTGGGLFGNTSNQNQGSSGFGSLNNQQQQGIGLGGSLLVNSQQSNNAPQGLTANLSDVSAYGSPSLFAGVGGSEAPNPGPLAVPLSGNPKPKRPSILPIYKFAPAATSRFGTPQKRGFGFSFSTYSAPGGSPVSISSTPNTLGRSLLGTSNGNPLSKSMSSSNLRRSFNTEDSILLPGAFSNSNNTRLYGSTGSKKLVINRELRSDLFSTPQKDKQPVDTNTGLRKLVKRVSFDTSVEADEGAPMRALPAPGDIPESSSEETPRQSKNVGGINGFKHLEMKQVNGKDKELAIVQEEGNSIPEPQTNGFDNAPGNYWMEPSREEIQNMNRIQRQKVVNFTVGRENVGSITFKIPVDLSSLELAEICGGIIQLEPRSATVYPVAAKKPPVGKGLNVPARISLEQSWPRGGRDRRVANDPKRFNKHIERLKRIVDTTFEGYDVDTGTWVFSVEHFTTYSADYIGDSEEGISSGLPAAVPLPNVAQPMSSDVSIEPQDDDTMPKSPQCGLPGAFDEQGESYEAAQTGPQAFLGAGSADSATHDVRLSLENEFTADIAAEYEMSDDEDMTRSSSEHHLAAEHDDASSESGQDIKRGTPGGILRARMRAIKDSVGPVKLEVADGDDWMEMLRKSVNPVKRDRHLLKELNESPSKKTVRFDDIKEADFRKSSVWGRGVEKAGSKGGFSASTQVGMDQGRGFATSIDLMNSLFEKPKPARQNLDVSLPSKGFPKWPYERQNKILAAEDSERAFHDASRPTWGPAEALVLTRSLDAAIRDTSGVLAFQRSSIQTARQEVGFAKLTTEPSKRFLLSQDLLTEIHIVDGVPLASLHATSLKNVFHHKDMNDVASIYEKKVWELASILFDRIDASGSEDAEHLVRKRKLSQFWTDLVEPATSTMIGLAATSEEKAVACLAGYRMMEACKHLLDGKDFRLGTLIPLIGTSDAARKDIREQLKSWHGSKILSEFSEAIRTIYELLSGNVCACEGLKGVPMEDRADSFVISRHFGLDWRQSFGLRLWYAISSRDDLSVAVKMFRDDLGQDREDLPRPWYVEQGISVLWNDEKVGSRQDLLWGLLQLYADGNAADLEAVLRPENSQLSPLDSRLRWQLGLALTGTGKASYGSDGVEKADAATIAYAAQLTGAGEWLEASFVLLHLHQAAARKKAVQQHLCQHASLIGPESGAPFSVLTEKYRIPARWLWEALALYMRSVKKDASAEVQCLLRAGSFVEAHHVLSQQVAPQAIIERDYASLSSLISQFQEHQGSIPEWALGGEIYSHFLRLIQHGAKGENAPPKLLDKLLAGLNAMKEDGAEKEMMRYAAVADMADETAREIMRLTKQKQDTELGSRILNLPLTQDRLLAYSVDLSLDRFREVMSH